MSMARILVVEDEKDISELLSLSLKREGHEVQAVYQGQDALRALTDKTNSYELVVLDWMLPEISGIQILNEMRNQKKDRKTPVLMVTARTQPEDIVRGLEAGADDYLAKPFEMSVFLARVRALLRRIKINEKEEEKYITAGNLIIDVEKYVATCQKKEIHLTLSEFRLVHALLRNQGRVLTREQLIEQVQGEGVSVIDRTIDTHIFGLRKKLGKCANIVETIRGVGYRVNADF